MKTPEIKNRISKLTNCAKAYRDEKDKQWFCVDVAEILLPTLNSELDLAYEKERIEAEND